MVVERLNLRDDVFCYLKCSTWNNYGGTRDKLGHYVFGGGANWYLLRFLTLFCSFFLDKKGTKKSRRNDCLRTRPHRIAFRQASPPLRNMIICISAWGYLGKLGGFRKIKSSAGGCGLLFIMFHVEHYAFWKIYIWLENSLPVLFALMLEIKPR